VEVAACVEFWNAAAGYVVVDGLAVNAVVVVVVVDAGGFEAWVGIRIIRDSDGFTPEDVVIEVGDVIVVVLEVVGFIRVDNPVGGSFRVPEEVFKGGESAAAEARLRKVDPSSNSSSELMRLITFRRLGDTFVNVKSSELSERDLVFVGWYARPLKLFLMLGGEDRSVMALLILGDITLGEEGVYTDDTSSTILPLLATLM
jgi:hypothetical protein